jgi:type IV secretory pathway VirJ component
MTDSEINSVPLHYQFQDNQIPGTDNIPYVIIREKTITDKNIIALLFSGDGGWYSFEQSISRHLAERGIPVLGIDTKKYFWNRKTPDKTASDITRLLTFYGKEWNKSRFILIGYSLGAEIVPFVLSRLPRELKSRVSSIVMLSPASNTDFEVHITDMLGIGNRRNTYDVIAEISGIQKIRQIIIYGENEKTRVPDLLKQTQVEIVRIPGDHHYKNNTALIIQVMEEKKAF